jgi:hypothetical protein
MISNKNLIECHITPFKKANLRLDKIVCSLDFINYSNISITQDWINFDINEETQLSVSRHGSINITTRVIESQINESINLLDKLAKKIIYHSSLANEKFIVEFCIVKSRLENFEKYLKNKFETDNLRIINYKLNSKIKVQIMKLDEEYVISIKGDVIEKIKETYLDILAGAINHVEDIEIANSVQIKNSA